MRIDPDPWLESILGYRVFRVVPSTALQSFPSEKGEDKTIFVTAGRGRAFYYAKVPTLNVAQVRAFTGAGFAVVDVSVTFSRPPGPIEGTSEPRIRVADVEPGEHEAVLRIAESSFVYSRFHLDPQIDNEQANAVKREWIRNYILGRRGERLLVAHYDGEPAGFLAVLSAQDAAGNRTRVIELVAVDRSFQGRGIGRTMVAYLVNDSAGAYAAVKVGTQVANIPSMSLYEKCGFQISETAYVLHAHLWNGKPNQ